MGENQKTKVDANSLEFRRGVEAGLESEDTKFFQAGYELGHELNELATQERVKENTRESPTIQSSSQILWMVKRVRPPRTTRVRARNSLLALR